jgi:hypothetical protein
MTYCLSRSRKKVFWKCSKYVLIFHPLFLSSGANDVDDDDDTRALETFDAPQGDPTNG